MDARQSRYDIPAYTEGWFQVAWTKDLGRGELKKVLQFGRAFTLFRGQDGKVGLIDDVCPHLGAHFSEGGCVKGNAVRCPHHAWEFDRSGASGTAVLGSIAWTVAAAPMGTWATGTWAMGSSAGKASKAPSVTRQ